MFKVELFETSNPTGYKIDVAPDYIESIDFSDIYDTISGACELLHGANYLEFKVGGFGSSSWPVDVSSDLMTIIEQLPDLFEWIDGHGQGIFNLDFYEQGVELRIIFSLIGDKVQINWKNWSNWKPPLTTEFSDLRELNTMFSKLLIKFITEAKKILFPMLENNQYFNEWCESNNLQNRIINE